MTPQIGQPISRAVLHELTPSQYHVPIITWYHMTRVVRKDTVDYCPLASLNSLLPQGRGALDGVSPPLYGESPLRRS